jgi:hypothetical protein
MRDSVISSSDALIAVEDLPPRLLRLSRMVYVTAVSLVRLQAHQRLLPGPTSTRQ